MSHLVEVPREPDAPGHRSDAELVVDVAAGILGASVGAGMVLVRAVVDRPVLRSAVAWRAPFVPDRLQPAALLAGLAGRGARHRVSATQAVERLLDHWTPQVAEQVLARLDLTGIVVRHVDIDDVVKAVDLEAVVARLDLDAIVQRVDVEAIVQRVDVDAIVQRVDLDAAVAGVDLNAAVEGVDIDAIAAKLDVDAVIDRIDLVAMVEEVITAIDLPAIIRDSTGSMASETVRSARMTGISADEAISRGIERHLFRRRRPPTTTGEPMDAPSVAP